jgi:ABC-2 type transport system ATP-binding protein
LTFSAGSPPLEFDPLNRTNRRCDGSQVDMGEAAFVGRIGGLAAALGIGAAVLYGGCGVASADTTAQSGAAPSSSTTSPAGDAPGTTTPAATTTDTTVGPGTAHTGSHPTAKQNKGAPSESGRHGKPAKTTASSATAGTDGEPSGSTTAKGADSQPDSATPPEPSTPGETAVAGSDTSAKDAVVSVSAAVLSPAKSLPGGTPPTPPTPVTPPDSPATWTAAAAARKESLVPQTPNAGNPESAALDAGAATVKLAAAVTQDPPPVVAVIQTPPLEWLQQIPIFGPVFVTPIVAAIHQIPILGDVIHPFIGYPVQPGTPGAPVSRDVMLTSFDGTQIYVHFMPASGLQAGQKATTILNGPGLGMPGATNLDGTLLDGIITDNLGAVGVGTLRTAGYNVVTWDPRGEYRSGGVLELDSPDFEARDTSAIISWVATQPEVQLDSPGDPRMGMVGASYGGGIQLVTAAADHRIDAIVPTIAWNTLNTSLYKSDAFKSGWGTLLTAALLLTGARPNPEVYPASVSGALTGSLTQAQQDLLAERGPGALIKDITAPTLLIQGTVDTLFSLQEADANALALMAAHVPTKVLWFCGGHGVCSNNLLDPTDGQVITEETLAWLAHYVKGQQDVSTGPQFEWVDQRGQYYSSTTYPATAGVSIVAASSQPAVLPLLPVLGGSGPLLFVLPIGGTKAANAVNLTIPAATGTTYVVGSPKLTMTYSGTGSSTHVYAQLVDDSTGAVLGNQVTPIPVTLDGQSRTITIPLEQVAQTLSQGQTLTLQIVASTFNYENLGAFGVLNVSNLQVSLPTITNAVAVDTSQLV